MTKSPCIQVCVIDPVNQWCYGCYRSLNEIAQWGNMSTQQRESVMAELEDRRVAAQAQQAQ